jgi:hypothetical protein
LHLVEHLLERHYCTQRCVPFFTDLFASRVGL